MATELGVAYLSIVPETSKIAPGIKTALGDSSGTAREADKAGKSIGARLSGTLTKTLKVGALAAGGAVVGTIGTALYKGFGRLQGIEQATAKLTGLGHSAKGVEKIMNNALASVRGTAFGLDEAATTAAGAVAAGVKPGKDLRQTLKLVADAATIAGTDMGSMGAIFNKVAASNKIQGDVIAQLNDAGIPIVQLLGKELGKTAEETLKLASQGKVNFDTFRKAMQKGLGGAAKESGKTVSGSFANMQAALGRLGASLLGGVFNKLPGVLQRSTERLDKLGPVATKVGAAVGTGLGKAVEVANRAFAAAAPVVQRFSNWLSSLDWSGFARQVATEFLPVFESVRAFLGDRLLPALSAVGTYLGSNLGPIITQAFGIFRDQVIPILASLYTWLYEKAGPAVLDLAAKVAANLKPALDAVFEVIQTSVLPVAQQMLTKLQEWGPTIGKVVGFIGGMVGKWIEFVSTVAGKVLPVVIKVAGWLLRNLWPALAGGAGIISAIIPKLVSFSKSVANAASAVADFARKVGDKIGKVVKWFQELPGRITSAIGNLGGLLANSGAELIRGFMSGFTKAWDKAKGVVEGVAGWIKDRFPGSPVKKGPLTAWNNGAAGKKLMGFLAKGIKGGAPGVIAATEKVADGIDKALKKKQLGKKMAAQMKGALGQMSKAAQAVQDVLAKHADTVSSIASSLAGEFNLSDIFADEKNVFGLSMGSGGATSVAAAIAARMRDFAAKLGALVGSGLPGTLIGEIASAGSVEGSRIADEFLRMSQADRNSIRDSYALFSSSTQGAGLAVANATHGGDIAKAQQSLEKALIKGLSGLGINVTVGMNKQTAVEVVQTGAKQAAKRGKKGVLTLG